jgi:hypothetical protein
MILEGIVTTLNADGDVNISPMGPIVDLDMRRLIFRPYPTSRTFTNLKRNGQGVFHVTDDVELLARAAVGTVSPLPPLLVPTRIDGRILADACRWYAFRIRSCDETSERAEMIAEVVEEGRIREFFGFNRGKHAVVEAAILATRVRFLPREEILREFDRLKVLVNKTGGPQEQLAFEFLEQYVRQDARGTITSPLPGT